MTVLFLYFKKAICRRYKNHNNKTGIKSLILEFLISLFTRTNLQHVESILAARVCIMVWSIDTLQSSNNLYTYKWYMIITLCSFKD